MAATNRYKANHERRGRKKVSPKSFDDALTKLEDLIDFMIERASCAQIDALAQVLLANAAGVASIHMSSDISDATIDNAKLLLPTDPLMRLLNVLVMIQDSNPSLTNEDVVDFTIARLQTPPGAHPISN